MAAATALNVQAEKLMLKDVVVVPDPDDHRRVTPDYTPQIGTIWRLAITDGKVVIYFHGPQMEEHVIQVEPERSISVIRLMEDGHA